MNKLKIEYIQIDKLKPYKNNARKHEEADVATIMASIKEFGFSDPIGICGDDNLIVEGHGRLLAAKKLGLKEIPCIHLDHLNDEERRAYALAHNKTAEMSSWDFDLLDLELDDIANIDMSDFGFDLQIDNESNEIVEDDVPDAPSETNVRLGDLFVLGSHRLICGNSTDIAVIDRLMDGVKADMVFTDSPYGINAVNDDGVCVAYGDNHVAQRGKYAKVIGDDTTETAQQAYDIYSQLCDKMILWGWQLLP